MTEHLDLTKDWLSGVPLAPAQRAAWDAVREELKKSRLRLQEMELKIEELEQKLREDELMHAVLSRPDFNREVARMLAFDERYGGQSSLLYFDLENLEELSTVYGRAKTQKALQDLCDKLLKTIRSSDILGRLGVDEFGLFMGRCDNDMAWKRAAEFAALMQACLTESFEGSTTPIVSYGAYSFDAKQSVKEGIEQAAGNVTRA